MSPELLAALYCVPIVLACVIGGWIPQAFRLTHTRMQAAVSFVAGVILGVGVLHLLPHGFFELDASIDKTVGWAMVGFLAMFFVGRFLHFHHHDAPDDVAETFVPTGAHKAPAAHAHHDHGVCDQHAHHAHQHGVHVHAGTWMGTAFGMTLHSLIDGVALAGAIQAEWHEGEGAIMAGLGVFLAVLLHKPFDSLTISMLMTSARCTPWQRRLISGLYAVVVPVGVAAFFLGIKAGGESHLLGATLGLAGGAFLCIATSDLLPELQFHTHDRLKLSVALLLGVGLAWGIIHFESAGHDHADTPTPALPAEHDHAGHDHHDH